MSKYYKQYLMYLHDEGAVVVEPVRRAERRRRRHVARAAVVVGGERDAAGARDGLEGGARGRGPRRAVVGAREGEAAGRPPRAGEGERALGGAGEGHGVLAARAWKRDSTGMGILGLGCKN